MEIVTVETASPSAHATLRRVVDAQATLFAVGDAAREPGGRRLAEESGLPCVSLFAGALGAMLDNVAPYLAAFPPASPFAAWWFTHWGRSIGVLVEAPPDLAALRRHFRTLLIVRGPQRDRYYFRFYDPRVLRVFLPSCTADELSQFFGAITAFYCESSDIGTLLEYRFDGNRLVLCPYSL